MSLLKRRKSPNPAERAFGFVRLGLKGLVAQRVARKAYKGYKIGKKLPLVAAVGGVGFVVAKKAKGSDSPEPPAAAPYTPPAAAPAPTAVAEAAPSPVAEPQPEPTPDPGAPETDTETEEKSPVENTPDVSQILEHEATTPLTPAAAGTGGAEGDDVPTDEESAEASGESTDAAPPKD